MANHCFDRAIDTRTPSVDGRKPVRSWFVTHSRQDFPGIMLWGAPTLEPSTWNEPVSTPNRIVAEPWSVSTIRFKSTATGVWDFHTHREHELLWSAGGTVTLEASEHLWMVPPMLGIWIPAGTAHRVRSDDGAVIFATYLTPDRIDTDWDSIVGIPMTGALREVLLHNENSAMPDLKRLRLQQVAIDLIHPVQAASLDIPLPRTPDLLSIAQQIIADPADDRTTSDWARTIGVSGRTLMRRFQADTGTTLTQWRILVRVRVALIEIAAGKPVVAVARGLGYANPGTFIDLFRQVIGHTPAAYFRSFSPVMKPHQNGTKPARVTR